MLGYFKDMPYVCRLLEKKNNEIYNEVQRLREVMAQNNGYLENARVFVTFEYEDAQRACLKAMSTGTIPALFDIKKTDVDRKFWNQPIPTTMWKPLNPDRPHEFVGEFEGNVLGVTQAPEPEDVQWENLDKEPIEVYAWSAFWTFVACCIIGVMCVIIVELSTYAAVFIAICNGALPTIMKILNSFEPHPNTTAQEASLLFKLVAARWTITALAVYVTTLWKDTVTNEKIGGVLGILIADALTTPTIRLLDMAGWFNKLVMAPMAKTQEGMQANFKGTAWFLAERFSDMTKTVYVCYFYSALIPGAYLIAAIALFYNFWVDKYCLLRVWQVKPPLDAKIVSTTRAHLAVVVVIHCITTLHYYAGWPFDSIVCKDEDGNFLSHTQEKCNGYYETDDGGYKTYAQETQMNLWKKGEFIYFHVRSYMRDDQAYSVVLYMVITFLAMILVTTLYFGGTFGFTLYTLFVGVPPDNSEVAKHPDLETEDYYIKGFTSNDSIGISYVETNAYVPQVVFKGIDNPQVRWE